MDRALWVLLIILMMSPSYVSSQSLSGLIVPSELNEPVQLDLGDISLHGAETPGYEHLSVFVQPEGDTHRSHAVQGRFTVEGNSLLFFPYFPWEKGITYLVRIKREEDQDSVAYQTFFFEERELSNAAAVTRIFPSSDNLPENLLRFYLYFDTPMKKGQAFDHIHLIDSEGNVDDRAFMEFKQELWSPDGKRLTILFDPGRIKRGVSTNLELGPALLEGNRYELTISSAWQDVYGQELMVETTKEFVVSSPYRDAIHAQQWTILQPASDTRDPLGIQFDRIMDHALFQTMIHLQDGEGNLIQGVWKLSEEEREIQFIPEEEWQSGRYQIVMDSRMEDVAGNNLNNLLDQSETNENDQGAPQQWIEFEL